MRPGPSYRTDRARQQDSLWTGSASVASMTGTEDHRVDPPVAADEATSLLAFLNYHRDTLRLKADGLDRDQLNTSLPPSPLTLAGLLKHLAVVESGWFGHRLRGEQLMPPFDSAPWEEDPDWEFHTASQDSPDELRALLDASIARSDAIITEVLAGEGLAAVAVRPTRGGEHVTLRWMLLHMIEEYARHNGHADLIRESIDGQTGE